MKNNNDKIENEEINIPAGLVRLKGILNKPKESRALILFAHGSGSGRLSPRNAFVAGVLQKAGLATLLMDLLTPEEETDRRNVFDTELLAKRLEEATRWSRKNLRTKNLRIGYFGASTGAAAALMAAAELKEIVGAVVSRGGRPDLAFDYLGRVISPTLLIVGGEDAPVILSNEASLEKLAGDKKLVIVPGATHLFEEPGTLEEAARLAADWFKIYLK